MPTLPPPELPLSPLVQDNACASLYKHRSWEHTGVYVPVAQPLTFLQEYTECQMWGGPAPSTALLPLQS